jgi:hypothetical protein
LDLDYIMTSSVEVWFCLPPAPSCYHMDGDSLLYAYVGLWHSELWHFHLTVGLHLRNHLGPELVCISVKTFLWR